MCVCSLNFENSECRDFINEERPRVRRGNIWYEDARTFRGRGCWRFLGTLLPRRVYEKKACNLIKFVSTNVLTLRTKKRHKLCKRQSEKKQASGRNSGEFPSGGVGETERPVRVACTPSAYEAHRSSLVNHSYRRVVVTEESVACPRATPLVRVETKYRTSRGGGGAGLTIK